MIVNRWIAKGTHEPKMGDFVIPDQWGYGENLKPGDAPVDASYPGCAFRLPLPTHRGHEAAVNVTVTGRIPMRQGFYRCRIEFVGDGEPSSFTGGKILMRGK
jgi:hypothetical protein